MASASATSTEKSSLIVYLKDLSGAGNEPETVRGFETDAQALSFARAYLCDSVENCRVAGAFGNDALESWKLFGEDVEVKKGEEVIWTSDEDVAQFVKIKAQPQERDWRALDPRAEIQLTELDLSTFAHEHEHKHECGNGCDECDQHHDHDEDNNEITVGL